jgi:hypothetical protein
MLDGRGNVFQFLEEKRCSLLPRTSGVCGAYPASTWYIALGVEGPGHDHDHLLVMPKLRIRGVVPPRRIRPYGVRGKSLAFLIIRGR